MAVRQPKCPAGFRPGMTTPRQSEVSGKTETGRGRVLDALNLVVLREHASPDDDLDGRISAAKDHTEVPGWDVLAGTGQQSMKPEARETNLLP